MKFDTNNNHEISFKQSALIETIFNTLNFILRSAAFDEELFFELVYKEENAFPFIVIKVRISEGEKLGWEQGPLFAHSSLLTIHLLAKENNLFFNISKMGGFMHFIYEPIQEKLEEFSSVN